MTSSMICIIATTIETAWDGLHTLALMFLEIQKDIASTPPQSTRHMNSKKGQANEN